MEPLQLIEHKLTKLGIEYDATEATLLLNEVDRSILNYCNIEEIPKELLYVRVNLCVDYYKYIQASIPTDDEEVTSNANKAGKIKAIAAGAVNGGTRYEFYNSSGNKTDILNAHIVDMDTLLTNYILQLNQFRRLVW